jgi:hypothetical protein
LAIKRDNIKPGQSIMTDTHIESLYQEACSALKARDYEYAIELLKRILVVEENYKDTFRLLAKAVRLRKLRWYKNPRLWGVLGLAVVFVLGIVIAPKIGSLFAGPAPTNTLSPTGTNTALPTSSPTATPTRSPHPTSTVTTIPAWVADFAQPILDAIANRPPISYGNHSAEKVRTSISFRVWSDGAATAIGKFDNISVWNLDSIPNLL